jgi:hypothetical protein
LVVEVAAEGLIDVTGDIFRGRVHAPERLHLVQEGVVQFFEKRGRGLFDPPEIDEKPIFSQLRARKAYFYFPVVTVEFFALTFIFPQLMGRSHVGDDLQFVQDKTSTVLCDTNRAILFLSLDTAFFWFRVWLAALGALPVNDNAGAGAVRTEDTIVKIEGIVLVCGLRSFLFDRSPAFHTIATLRWDVRSANRTGFSADFLVTMGAFHDVQLFFEVLT